MRDYYVNGATMVNVKGNGALAISNHAQLHELGLSSEAIRITPRYVHRDIHCDEFGPDIPPDVMWELAECRIDMTLIHFDRAVLGGCLIEAMAGGAGDISQGVLTAGGLPDGILAPAGMTMGNGLPLMTSGNHYASLNLISSNSDQQDWRFPASYLCERPMEFPLGTEKSLLKLSWRAIPYAQPSVVSRVTMESQAGNPITSYREVLSSGAVLWDHTPDEA